MCQKLVSGIVRGVLARLQTDGFVYLDNILLVVIVKQGARCVAQKSRRARFLISPKSVCERTQRLDFIGNWFANFEVFDDRDYFCYNTSEA